MKKTKTKNKNKIEFSKIITIIAIIIFSGIAIWSMVAYYELIKLAVENGSSVVPDSSLPVACITTILGAILSYCLYQAALKSSLNKNKLTVDKITGEIKSIQDGKFLDTVQQTIEDSDANIEE